MNALTTQTLVQLLPIFNQLSADQFNESTVIIRTQLFPHFLPGMNAASISSLDYRTRTQQYLERRNECCACDWSVVHFCHVASRIIGPNETSHHRDGHIWP